MNITDDDTSLVSVAPASVVEGNSGTSVLNALVSLSVPSVRYVTVTFATEDLGTVQATAGGVDYDTVPATTLTFAPGQTLVVVPITIRGDLLGEPLETFGARLTSPARATRPWTRPRAGTSRR